MRLCLTFLINKDTLINAVTIEYKSIFDFNIKLQTLQNFIEGTDVSARLLGSDLAQAMVNQEKLIKLLKEINSDDDKEFLVSLIIVFFCSSNCDTFVLRSSFLPLMSVN
jgi:hypothetical protein